MKIAFIGTDGCGKSTQIVRARNWLLEQGADVEIVNKWAILDRERVPECRFIDSELTELQVCVSEMKGLSRAMFLFWSNMVALEQMNLDDPDKVLLFDGYWQKHAAAEAVFGVSRDWLHATASLLPKADMTLWFDADINTTTLRKYGNYTPYECGRAEACSPESFKKHQLKLRSELIALQGEGEWKRIDAGLVCEAVWEDVKSAIRGSLPGGFCFHEEATNVPLDRH